MFTMQKLVDGSKLPVIQYDLASIENWAFAVNYVDNGG